MPKRLNMPTIAEAEAVWRGMKRPSVRKVAAALTDAGKPISYRAIARWKKNRWRDPDNDAVSNRKPKHPKEVEAHITELQAIIEDTAAHLTLTPIPPDAPLIQAAELACRAAFAAVSTCSQAIAANPMAAVAAPASTGRLLESVGKLME